MNGIIKLLLNSTCPKCKLHYSIGVSRAENEKFKRHVVCPDCGEKYLWLDSVKEETKKTIKRVHAGRV